MATVLWLAAEDFAVTKGEAPCSETSRDGGRVRGG